MTRRKLNTTLTTLAVLLVFATFQWTILASNSWGGYHWARTANPVTVNLGDNVSSTWDPHLAVASFDWTNSPTDLAHVLNTSVVTGQANPRNCRPTSGRVEVCNATYGNNGWLGIAQVWVSGLHITQGTVKLNDTYFNTPTYNTPDWRQLVTCQEIGHTFGLDHQDENFSNPNLNTCMDYTNNPFSNQHPNHHDYEELALIYGHNDTTTSTSQTTSPGASNVDPEQPSQWGQLMKSSRGGRSQVFERDLGNGERIVTFVIWG